MRLRAGVRRRRGRRPRIRDGRKAMLDNRLRNSLDWNGSGPMVCRISVLICVLGLVVASSSAAQDMPNPQAMQNAGAADHATASARSRSGLPGHFSHWSLLKRLAAACAAVLGLTVSCSASYDKAALCRRFIRRFCDSAPGNRRLGPLPRQGVCAMSSLAGVALRNIVRTPRRRRSSRLP